MKVFICCQCGSANVVRDAFVHVNDPDDVLTFDDIYCEACGSSNPGLREVEVGEDFDIYFDNVFELTGE